MKWGFSKQGFSKWGKSKRGLQRTLAIGLEKFHKVTFLFHKCIGPKKFKLKTNTNGYDIRYDKISKKKILLHCDCSKQS